MNLQNEIAKHELRGLEVRFEVSRPRNQQWCCRIESADRYSFTHWAESYKHAIDGAFLAFFEHKATK